MADINAEVNRVTPGFQPSSGLESFEQSQSQVVPTTFIDIKALPRVKNNLSIINNPNASSEEQYLAYTDLQNFTKELVIDADTFSGKPLGLTHNVRSSLIDALEDPNKNKSTKPGDIGTTATEKVRDKLLNDLILVQDEKVGMYLEGKTDMRKDSGAVRELGYIISQYKDKPAEASVDAMLLNDADAVKYKDKNESIEDFKKNREAERKLFVSLYNKYLETEDPKIKERLDRLISKSRYVNPEFLENVAESGFGSSPLDFSNAFFAGVGNVLSATYNTQGAIANTLGFKDFAKASFKHADKYKAKANEMDQLSEKSGLFNTEETNPYGVNLAAHLIKQRDVGEIIQTGLKGLVQGIPEIALSGGTGGLVGYSTIKAGDIAREQVGDDVDAVDMIKRAPNAVAYTVLNKVEGSLLANKLIKGSGVAGTAAKVLGSAGVEGVAEGVQSLAETTKPGSLPTKENLLQARNEAVLGFAGGGTVGTVQSTAENVATAVIKAQDLASAVKTLDDGSRSIDTVLENDAKIEAEATDVNTAIEEGTKEDPELNETVLKAEEYQSRFDKESSRLSGKMKRASQILQQGRFPDKADGTPGRELTADDRKEVSKELNNFIDQKNKLEADAAKYFQDKIKSDIKNKYIHLDTDALNSAIERRKKIIDALKAQTAMSSKQKILNTVLNSEIKAINKIIADKESKTVVEAKSEPQKPTSKQETVATEVKPQPEVKKPIKQAPAELAVTKETMEEEAATAEMEAVEQEAAKKIEVESTEQETIQQPTEDSWSRKAKDGYEVSSRGDKEPATTATSGYVNHSGGALGSDTVWAQKGEQYGVKTNAYYAGKKTPTGNVQITEEQALEADEHLIKANETLNRKFPTSNNYVNNLLRRNWQQVKNADSVYAIGNISGNTVQGGTGWAVQMAIDNGKPTYVFDQVTNQWHEYVNDKFVPTETPTLTKNFAGIGTRQISDVGRQAISDVYAKTFATEEVVEESTVEENEDDTVAQYNTKNKEVVVNENYEKIYSKADNVFTQTGMYDLFNNNEFVNYLSSLLHRPAESFTAGLNFVKELYPQFEAELNNNDVRKPFGEMSHPADELAYARIGSGLIFDKRFSQSLFAIGLSSMNTDVITSRSIDKNTMSKLYGDQNADKFKEILEAGASRNELVYKIGSAMLKQFNIGSEMSSKQRDNLAADIGLMFVTKMATLGLVKPTTVELKDESGKSYSKTYIKFTDKIDTKQVRSAESVLVGVSQEQYSMPQSEPYSPKKSYNMKKNDGFQATTEISESMDIRSSNPNYINWDLVKQFESLTEPQKKAVLKITDPKQVHIQFRDSEIAKNDNIVREYELSSLFLDMRRGNNEPIYFEEFFGGNGRSYIDSNMFNYQLDKNFARHLIKFYAEPQALNDKGVQVFKSAVLLALGEKPEYYNEEQLNEFWNNLKPMSMDEIVELSSKEEGMFTFQALIEMNRAKEYEKQHGSILGFKTDLSTEIDGVTNGPAFLAFQAGVSNRDVFNKVGVFFESDGSLANYRANGGLDSYETINQIVHRQLDDINDPKLEEFLQITRKLGIYDRNLAKKPVMVFGYGMNTKGVTAKVAESIVERLIEATMDADTRADANKALQLLGAKQADNSNRKFTSYELYEMYQKAMPVAEVYGIALAEMFGDVLNYTDYLKAINNNMFNSISALLRTPKYSNLAQRVYETTGKEKEAAIKALVEVMPALKTFTFGDNDRSTYQPAFKQYMEINSGAKSASERNWIDSDGNKKRMSVKEKSPVFESGEKLAPVYIHRMDSTNMAIATTFVNKRSHGQAKAHNIFDAVISHVNDVPMYGEAYNTIFYEINKKYSVLESAVEEAERIMMLLDKEGIDYDKSELLDSIEKAKKDTLRKREVMKRDIIPDIRVVAQMNGAPHVSYNVGNNVLKAGENIEREANAKKVTSEEVVNSFNTLLKNSNISEQMANILTEVVRVASGRLVNGLRMKINTDQEVSGGLFDRDTSTITVATNEHTKSPASLLAHELIHSVTETAIDDMFSFADKKDLEKLAKRVTSFMDKNRKKLIDDGYFETHQEINQLIDAINKSPSHEILAYGLTHPGVVAVLNNMPVAIKKDKNAFQTVWRIIKRVFEKMVALVNNKKYKPTKTEFDSLMRLYSSLSATNKKIVDGSVAQETASAVYKLVDGINEGLSKAVRKSFTTTESLFGLENINYSNIIDMTIDKSEATVNRLLKMANIDARMNVRNNRTLQSIGYSFFGSGDKTLDDALAEIAKEHTNEVEKRSNEINEVVTETLQKELNLDADGEIAVKRAIVDSGAIDLFVNGTMSMDELVRVIKNEAELNKTLSRFEDNLKQATGKYYKNYNVMIDGLVFFMKTQRATIPFLQLNARKIVETFGMTFKEGLVTLVDDVITLRAIREMNNNTTKQLSDSQLKTVLQFQNQFKEYSKPFFEKHDRNAVKGYSYNVFNDNSEIMILEKDKVSIGDLALLEASGWKVFEKRGEVVKLKNKVPQATWNQGFMAILDRGRRGYSKYITAKEVGDARKELMSLDKIDRTKDYAIYDATLGGTSKRWVMSRREMRDNLRLEERISFVTGATTSRMFRKYHSEMLNEQIVNLLKEDYDNASRYDKANKFDTIVIKPQPEWFFQGKKDDEYINQLEDYEAQSEEMKEIEKLLPSKIKLSVRDRLYVRKRIKDVIFGYRELIIDEALFNTMNAITFGTFETAVNRVISPEYQKKADYLIRLIDYNWKEFVKWTKERVVVLNPVTHFGNLLSNTMLLSIAGVPIEKQIKSYPMMYRALDEYREVTSKLIRAQVAVASGDQSAQKLVDKYNAELAANPAHESMTNGLFSFIAEDVLRDIETDEKNPVKLTVRNAIRAGGKLFHIQTNDQLGAAMKRLYVDIDTQEGIEFVKMLQYSDFIAKDLLYKHQISKGMSKKEALDYANKMFIDYRYNDSQFLDFMNKVALFPFSKFAIRIQPILGQLAIDRPASLAVSLFTTHFLFSNSIFAENFVYNTHFGIHMLHGLGTGADPMDLALNPIISPFV